MSKATTEQKQTRTRYSSQCKNEALALAEYVEMSKAAALMDLMDAQLYA